MLGICSSIEADDPRFESCLRSLWTLPIPFEHVIVLNRCSEPFSLQLDALVSSAPPHVIVKVARDDIQVAKAGLESLLTNPDDEHSSLQFKRRCTSLCTGPWVMLTDVSFVATPEWVAWFSGLHLENLTEPKVMISMHLKTPKGSIIMAPKLFNFEPAYRRHYWWDLPLCLQTPQLIQNLPAHAFESQWPDTPVHNPQPWFADKVPLLESTLTYAQQLLPSEEDRTQYIEAVSALFDPEGNFRDSTHVQWTQLGAAALQAMRGDLGDEWRSAPTFASLDYVSYEQARVYWSKIYAFEFELSDLQPICEECDAEGGVVVEQWPDGLQASGTTLKHLFHALFCLDQYHNVESVVEIGAGYGGFAKAFLLCAKLCNRPVNSYTIAEVPAMQLICNRYLSEFQSVVQFMDPSLCGEGMALCSLLISIDGISEFASTERETYIRHCVPRAHRVFMRWGCTEIPNDLLGLKATPDWSSSDVRHLLLYS